MEFGQIHGGAVKFLGVAVVTHDQPGSNWTKISGNIRVQKGMETGDLYFVVNKKVEFLIDYCSVTDGSFTQSSWKADALSKIEKTRNVPLTINIAGVNNLEEVLTAELTQLDSEFAWGTVVNTTYIDDLVHTKYQNFVYDNFNWAVTDDAFEWRSMEYEPLIPSYRWKYSLDTLLMNGMKVLGKAMFWDDKNRAPHWLSLQLSPSGFKEAMAHHMKYVLNVAQGALQNWIVNNRDLQSDFYEKGSGDLHVTQYLFKEISRENPNINLFLNEEPLLSDKRTNEYKNQTEYLKSQGVRVYGIGVEARFSRDDIEYGAITNRLDKLAEAGIPIWITALVVDDPDKNTKATKLRDLVTLFYSKPYIHGIMLGALWDGDDIDAVGAIANGNNMTLNAAGLMYQKLRHDWNSNKNMTLSPLRPNIFRVAPGDYRLEVKKNGVVVHRETVHVDKSGKTLIINIQGSFGVPFVG